MKKEEYDKLKEKHPNLPAFEDIDNEFEISTIEQKTYQLRAIRRRITEKIERLVDILQSILLPDPNSFVDIYECRAFDDEEKKEIFEICRKLMYYHRKMIETAIKRNDDADAQTITEAHDEWLQNKNKVISYLTKLKESWQKDIKTKEILNYMG